MYSYEDRIRAVKLYIKLGKRTGAIIRSYPQTRLPTGNATESCRAHTLKWVKSNQHVNGLIMVSASAGRAACLPLILRS